MAIILATLPKAGMWVFHSALCLKLPVFASASRVLGLKACTTMPSFPFFTDGILGALGSFIGNMTANKNFTVDDIAGVWAYSAPAVSFKSESALKNVGGAAAATAVENKLAPYYKTLGFTRTTLTIGKDHTFSMKMGIIPLKGTVEKTDDGSLEFTFTGITGKSLGKVDAVATKSGNNLNLTFDATKFIAARARTPAATAAVSVMRKGRKKLR